MTQSRYISLVLVTGGVSTALSLLALMLTTPLGIGPLGVTLWFLMVLAALSSWLSLAAYFSASRIISNYKVPDLAAASSRRGFFVGGYITTLLALGSLKQLSLRDALLLALLLALAEFYMVAKA